MEIYTKESDAKDLQITVDCSMAMTTLLIHIEASNGARRYAIV